MQSELKIHHASLAHLAHCKPIIYSIKKTPSRLTFLTKRKEHEQMATILKKGKKWQAAICKKDGFTPVYKSGF